MIKSGGGGGGGGGCCCGGGDGCGGCGGGGGGGGGCGCGGGGRHPVLSCSRCIEISFGYYRIESETFCHFQIF